MKQKKKTNLLSVYFLGRMYAYDEKSNSFYSYAAT